MSPVWSFILEGIGISGAILAGRRRWYAWPILFANTILWGVYAVVTDQYGFLIASFFYAPVYARNAWKWYRSDIDEATRPWTVDEWAEFYAGFHERDQTQTDERVDSEPPDTKRCDHFAHIVPADVREIDRVFYCPTCGAKL